MSDATIVIPCYNEHGRLPTHEFLSFADKNLETRFLLVDDGSQDGPLAPLTLSFPVYDAQRGAKLLRSQPEMRALFEEPFISRWIFDVEILARLIRLSGVRNEFKPERILVELPLQHWADVPGSKVHAGDFFRAMLELNEIRRRYLRNH